MVREESAWNKDAYHIMLHTTAKNYYDVLHGMESS